MLRKISLGVVASMVAISSLSASPLVVPIGIIEHGNQVDVKVAPTASIMVDVESQTESFEAGVYARYAQKYLGVRASLISKSTAVVTSANIVKLTDPSEVAPVALPVSPAPTVTTQPLAVDVTSSEVLPAEQAAERAAAEIFRLRRLRRDLLSGELGEGFFGGGLAAALAQIESEESELVEMFFGKSTTSTTSRRFVVTLEGKEARYVVCRFSATKGVVDASDLSAEPILLQITPSKQDQITPPTADVKAELRTFRVANQAKCELYFGSKVLAQSVMPLFEFGYTLSCPIIIKK